MTHLEGPYDQTSTYEKIQVRCMIPDDLHKSFFLQRFPLRGAQDKILARLFASLVNYLDANELCLDTPTTEAEQLANEETINTVLNHVRFDTPA